MQVIGDCQKLICVNYPGSIQNVSKMYDTLGGPTAISEVFCDRSRKLQLRFRPADSLCKPVMGNRKPSSSLLLKIRVKKKSKKIVFYQVIGTVLEEFHFNSLCDFQYIAMENDVNIYNKIIPTSLNVDWFKEDAPLVLTPAVFARNDNMQSYYFGQEKNRSDGDSVKVISTTRRKRFGFARFLSFEDDNVPTMPRKIDINNQISRKIVSPKLVEQLKELFEERPIFSRSAMAGLSGISQILLRDLAPFVAYHFHNGPWRALWVRFGYDPRKDPQARIYQVLDFRLKGDDQTDLVEIKRKKKRLPLGGEKKKVNNTQDVHVLKPGTLPPSRQFFYQYCDVHLPEVQAVLSSVVVRQECHPTDGWLPEGTSFACRRIINQYIAEAAQQHKDEGTEMFSSEDEPQNSESEQDTEMK